MKKLIGIIVSIIIVGGVLLLVSSNGIINLGSTKYYVKTVSEYKDRTSENSGGYNTYEYKINGYDKDGNEKLITFTTSKILKVDRYLKVYVKGEKTKSYEEVEIKELPDKVKEIYKLN
ncbi:YxeA family protein [Clostridium sp. UBA7503]|uniref:YxeA family protein n=1 Tax=Clostridium sp. UBA7503 TaxID=1946377 RepID=UPI003216D97E